MSNINSIISGIIVPAISSVPSGPATDFGVVQSGKSSEVKDRYSHGQENLNRARAKDQGQGEEGSLFTQIRRAYDGLPYFSVSLNPGSSADSETAVDEGQAQKGRMSERDGGLEAETADEQSSAAEQSASTAKAKPNGEPLTGEELQAVARLKAVDLEVRAHEMAHLAAAGSYAKGGASFQYKQGPDGKKYAVGGEVQIDVGREASPEQTISKMRIVRRAALAPASPSPQDQRVASRATLSIAEASQELSLKRNTGENSLEEAAEALGGGRSEDEVSAVVVGAEGNESRESSQGADIGPGVPRPSNKFSQAAGRYGLAARSTGLDLFA